MEKISLFFAIDDNYCPFLSSAVYSILKNANKNYKYDIYVLHNGIAKNNQDVIKTQIKNDASIEFVDMLKFIDMKEKLEVLADKLVTRDYYTKTTYYRLFIPNMFPNLDKALYLDSDIIVTGDISPQDNLMLETIKGALSDCIYEITNKNLVSFSPNNRILTNFLIIGQKYDFKTELTKYGACLYAKNTDGEDCPWIKYLVVSDLFSITGNTDYLNLWFCDTRPDLTPERIMEFVKDLNWALESNEPILLKDLIDPEDWQEIADVRDAYEDERYINN